MSYAFAPPKALAALIIFAAHQRQGNQQHYDSYNKINGKVIYIIHLLIRPSFFRRRAQAVELLPRSYLTSGLYTSIANGADKKK